MPVPCEWRLDGKVAIITGDQRGWTPFLASAMSEAGARIAVVGYPGSDIKEAADAVRKQGGRVLMIEADLTRVDDLVGMLQETVSEFGTVDVLVNGARFEFGKPFLEVTEAEWDVVMNLNVKSMFLCCQVVGRHMLEHGGGRIVNIGSGLAARAMVNSTVVCASQGAMRQLTAALALEWARNNIRVNAIGAGWMDTDVRTKDHGSELLERYIPLKRKGHPRDLSGLLVYLASDACDFVSGQMLYIDGGVLAHA